MSTKLIITVGSSPLPVIVSILALKPSVVQFIYTPDVQEVVNRICNLLKDKLQDCKHKFISLPEHFSSNSIVETLNNQIKESCEEYSLNYTGGTKLMAVHTYAFWREKRGQPRNASYLGSDGKLYFDAPERSPILEKDLPSLSLNEQCLLHFGGEPDKKGDEHKKPKRLELADRINGFLCEKGTKTYKDRLRNDIDNFGQELGINKTEIRSNQKFLQGEWLEVWLADQLSNAKIDGKPLFDEIHQHIEYEKKDAFEMDVIATRGYRVFLFSCTAKIKRDEVKLKFFEAVNRAARIGGEHARAAMVCLYPQPHELLKTVQEEHWPGYDTLRLFGEPHIRGKQAICRVTADKKESPPEVTLLEGIKQWIRS